MVGQAKEIIVGSIFHGRGSLRNLPIENLTERNREISIQNLTESVKIYNLEIKSMEIYDIITRIFEKEIVHMKTQPNFDVISKTVL